MLAGGESVGSPVKGVTAVIYCAAGLGRIMDGAEVLPLGGAHLRTGLRRARRLIGEESSDDDIDLLYQKSAELVQPWRTVDAVWWLGKE